MKPAAKPECKPEAKPAAKPEASNKIYEPPTSAFWNKPYINFYAVSSTDDMKKASIVFMHEGKCKNRTV